MDATAQPLLISVSEAARLASCSTWTIRQLIANGDVVAVRAGDRLLVNRESFLEWVATPTTRVPKRNAEYTR